jgi:hypothetical protein
MEKTFMESAKQFFSPKEQVLTHWYTPVDNFEFPTADFYSIVEKELTARKVPGLEISRVEFSEGGMLSAKRDYLRLKRERLVFDICAAPFGTGYFFSFRFVELPLGIKPIELLALFIALIVIFSLLATLTGLIAGVLLFLVLVIGGIWFLRNAVALGLKDMDAAFLKIPIIGPLYELLVRKETYYREDTRLMYLTTVNGITTSLVDQVTAAKGIKLVKRFDRHMKGDLYEEKMISTVKAPDAGA